MGINMTTKTMVAVATIPKPRQAGWTLAGRISPASVHDSHRGSTRPSAAPMYDASR